MDITIYNAKASSGPMRLYEIFGLTKERFDEIDDIIVAALTISTNEAADFGTAADLLWLFKNVALDDQEKAAILFQLGNVGGRATASLNFFIPVYSTTHDLLGTLWNKADEKGIDMTTLDSVPDIVELLHTLQKQNTPVDAEKTEE